VKYIIFKRAKILFRHFMEQIMQTANTHMKRCFSMLVIKGVQIKTTKYDFRPTRIIIIKNQTNRQNKCWSGCGETGILLSCWGKGMQNSKILSQFFKKLNRITTRPNNSTHRYIPKKIKTMLV
jgi:hypothetical protein